MDIPFQQVGLNTTQRFIVKIPDIVRRAVKSIVEGVHLIRSNPAVAKRAIGRYMQIQDDKVLEESYQQLKGTAEIKPYPSAEGGRDKIKLIANRYLKKGDIKIEDAEKALNHPIHWNILNEYDTAMSCLNRGVPLSIGAPKPELNHNIKELAKSITRYYE